MSGLILINFSPTFLLGTLFCLCYAACTHFLSGRTFRDLTIYLLMGSIGFGFGQLIGNISQSPFLQIGDLHLFEATLAAWMLLGVAYLMERR